MVDMRDGTDWDAVAEKFEKEQYEWDRPRGRIIYGRQAREYTRVLFELYGWPERGDREA